MRCRSLHSATRIDAISVGVSPLGKRSLSVHVGKIVSKERRECICRYKQEIQKHLQGSRAAITPPTPKELHQHQLQAASRAAQNG